MMVLHGAIVHPAAFYRAKTDLDGSEPLQPMYGSRIENGADAGVHVSHGFQARRICFFFPNRLSWCRVEAALVHGGVAFYIWVAALVTPQVRDVPGRPRPG